MCWHLTFQGVSYRIYYYIHYIHCTTKCVVQIIILQMSHLMKMRQNIKAKFEAFLDRDALTANYVLMLNLSKLNLNPFYNIQHLTTSLELKKVLTSQ